MLRFGVGVAVMAALGAVGAARAEDKVLLAPPAAWVKPSAIPKAGAEEGLGAIQVLLQDTQTRVEADGTSNMYVETAFRFLTPEALAAGNIQLPWNPELGSLTVHKLHIIRGDQVIDVLKTQQFTVLRRETNLERAALDGALTAALQPEGLQVGDVIDMAVTFRSRDPALKGHAEFGFVANTGVTVERMHMRALWPKSKPLQWRQTPDIGTFARRQEGDWNEAELTRDKVRFEKPPSDAPERFREPPLAEAVDFASWADLSALMSGLYEEAATLKPDSPLKAEAARIKAASSDPKVQAGLALQLVESRVRYLFLGIDDGGYKPAAADLTWSRRYGDCKGKTVLLLALLHEIGIPAQPAVVNAEGTGDGVSAHLPRIGLFDHVLVRTSIGGKTYWLDGTRTGDRNLDDLTTPNYGWALPIQAKDAKLEKLVVPPLDKPSLRLTLHIDASAGLDAPAPAHLEAVYSGDVAAGIRLSIANTPRADLERSARSYWTDDYTWYEPKTATVTVDEKTGEVRYVSDGVSKMNWDRLSGGLRRYESDFGTIGWNADFHREPGPNIDAPYAVNYPGYTQRLEEIVLPDGGKGFTFKGDTLDVTVAARRLQQKVTLDKGVFRIESSTRTLAPEFPAAQAPAAQEKLRELNKSYVFVLAANYTPTKADAALAKAEPQPKAEEAETFEGDMAAAFAALHKGDAKGMRDNLDAAIRLQPRSALALTTRATLRASQDLKGAEEDLAAAEAADPGSKTVVMARATVYQNAGQIPRSIEVMSKAIAAEPGDFEYLVRRAWYYGRNKQPDLAAKDLTAAAAIKPDDPTVRETRLAVAEMNRDWDGYLAAADDWVKAKPFDADALNTRALALARLHRRDDALAAYSYSISVKPTAWAYSGRAELRPAAQLTQALADTEAALKLEPEDFSTLEVRAKLLYTAKRDREADALFDDLVAKRPGDAILLNNVCWSKATTGRALESALQQCNAAVKLHPDIPGFLDSRGLVELRLGKLDAAIADYDKAIAGKTGAVSIYGRGVARLKKGDRKGGEADLAEARKLDPKIDETFQRFGVTPDRAATTKTAAAGPA